jgi:uncharacterized phage protein (TIGR01671 family)
MRGKEREIKSINGEEWEMREIKFRTWNKIFKEMTYFDFNTILKKQDSLYSIHDEYCYSNETMQYTGFKDKNDQEIYEGDILKRLNNRLDGTYTVVWEDNGFKIEYKFTRKYEGEEYEDKNFIPIYSDSYEVIGNIYEGVKKK